MNASELANRFSNYADAVVAFAVLNAVGFLSAIGEEDVRNEVSEIPYLGFILGVYIAAGFYTALAVVFRYAEKKLREEAGETASPRVIRYQRHFQIARIFVIWFSACLTTLVFY